MSTAQQTPPTRETPPDDGRSRLWRAVTRPSRGQVVVAVLLALVGFAGVTQVRTNTVDDTYAGLREQDLIDVLNNLANTTQRAQTEIQRLEATRDDLLDDSAARQAALDEARKQVDVLSILAGTVPVTGPGVEVSIDEDAGAIQLTSFIDLVQALRTAGAEAMQVSGEGGVSIRVVAQTSFEDAVGGLNVGGRLLEPPYTVEAIGSPDNLVAALRFPDGPEDQFTEDGAELTYRDRDEVRIDTVTTPARADFAGASQ